MKIVFLLLLNLVTLNIVYEEESYTLKTYKDFHSLIQTLMDDPNIKHMIKFEEVFEKYTQIKRPQCPVDYTGLCKSYLFTIADYTKGPDYINKLPTVLLIGGFHGNEVTGSNSLYRLIEIFHKYGKLNPQLQEILNKVKIMILPTANVTGFSRQEREDFTDPLFPRDPNRDFPFNVKKNQKCLQTSTSQIIDQIFRDNLIISTLTFHGGDNSITYPWGNFAHKNPITGDNIAFQQIANLLKDFAGANDDLEIEEYQTGTMKDVVYDVNGGFEDWAYGASWDKQNVPKFKDGKNVIPPYNDLTNRAFVYLVEAGYDKIPDDNELGNELSVFHPYDENAIWGHISRNTFMCLKFMEYQNPYIVIDEVKYNRGLIMKIVVKGCVHVTYLKILNQPFFILSQKFQPSTGYHVIIIIIKQTKQYMEDIGIEAQCDQEWFDETVQLKPESHLVKLRTDPHYEVVFKEQSVQSQNIINARLVNIKIQEIKDAYLKQGDNNIFSFVYTSEFRIDMPADKITVFWEDGEIKFETKSGLVYNLVIRNYGAASCCTNETNGQVPYMQISTNETAPISQYQYSELLGKSVEIADPRIGQTLFYSHVQIINEDPFSALVLPKNGLTCYSEVVDDYHYITIKPFIRNMLNIELLTNIFNKYKVVINNLEIDLELDNKFQQVQGVYKYSKNFELKNYNNYRMWGAELKLVDSYNNKIVFKDILKPFNPYFDEVEQIKKSNGFLKIHKHIENQILKQKQFSDKRENKNPIIIVILLIIIVIIILAVFLTTQNKNKKNQDKKENDLTNIQQQAKNDPNKILVNQFQNLIMQKKLKLISRNYVSKFLYVNDTGTRESFSNLSVTLFGATGKIGPRIGYEFGSIGSDLIFPYRNDIYNETTVFLKMAGHLGQTYVYPYTNFDDPGVMRRLIKESNVVVNMIGPSYRINKLEDYQKANILIPRRIAKLARKQGVKKFIHFSAVGVDENSESLDLQTKFLGEQAVREEFPEAVILRLCPVVGHDDDVHCPFQHQINYFFNSAIIYDNLKAKFQPILIDDVAKCALNAVKLQEANGKTYELGGPHIYTRKEFNEILMNIVEAPINFVKANRKAALQIARFLNSRYFNQELIRKNTLDLTVNENVLTAKDLLVETGSVIPFIDSNLEFDKRPLYKTKDEVAV